MDTLAQLGLDYVPVFGDAGLRTVNPMFNHIRQQQPGSWKKKERKKEMPMLIVENENM